MKRLSIALSVLIISALPSFAGNTLRQFASWVASSFVSFDYSFATKDKVPLSGSGRAEVQGDSFRLVTEGLEICCDAVSRWSADKASKELVIENVFGDKDYAGNPALLVSSLEEAFEMVSQGQSKFRGKVCHVEVLSPKEKSGIARVKAFFDAKGNLLGAEVTADEGTVTEIVISSLVFRPVKASGYFMFDTSLIDQSWVVTDLR